MLQQFRKKLQVHRSVLLGILTLCLSSLCLSSLCFSSSYIIASGSQPNVTWSVCPVNCDYTTIQAAINDTQVAAGDTIQLKANMPHTEVGILIDKNLTIEGVGTDFTVLQAADSAENATDRVLNIVDGIDVTIQKMTIRHGKSSGESIPDAGGGGIRSGSGNLSLIDVLLTDNLSHSQGAGLYNDGGDLVIHNSSIENNDSRSNGGGIYSKGSLTLINEESDARIYNNEAQGSRGGGIYHNGGAFSLSGVQVRFNRSGRGGGGLYIRAAQATIDAATISQNRSGHKNDLDDDPDCGGAGIFNSSLLAISNSTIDSNIIDKCSDNFNGHGGGILHTSELLLTIRGSEIAGNRVPLAGAGVYSTGPLHIEQSTIRINNRNGTNSYGGVGVVAKGPTLMMKEVNLHSNIDGAALHISSGTRDVVLDGVDIWQNQNPNGRGGGIKIDGYDETSNITLRNSVIRENSALMGGGIYVENGFIGEVEPFNLMIEDSGIISNSALIKSPNDALHGQGGGLWLHGTALTMVQSLVQGNHAENHGGGMVLNGEFDLSYDTPRSRTTIVNSTISGNSTLENGGGIYVDDYRPGPVLLVHATISDNIADMDGSSGTNGGGIHREGTSFDVSLHNTIIAGNRDLGPLAFTKTAPDCNGSFQTVNHDVVQGDTLLIGTLGISIFGDPTAPPPCTILGDGVQTDISLTDLELGQLADNGGDTMTHAIGANSIAFRSGQAACDAYDILLDQRGYVRPDQCDIGAYEFSGVKPQPTATSTSEPEPSPTPTTTNTLVPDPTPTTEPLTTSAPSPTLTATNSPVPGSTPIPTPTATITPTAEPTPVPTTEPLATPSASPTPDASPTSSSTPLLSPTTVATVAPVGSGAETVYIPLMTN